MTSHRPPKTLPPRHGHRDEDPEPDLLPVDPDQGPAAPQDPADPQQDGVIDPPA